MVKLKETVNIESGAARKDVHASEHISATPAEKADHITETNGLKQIGEDITRNKGKDFHSISTPPKIKVYPPQVYWK